MKKVLFYALSFIFGWICFIQVSTVIDARMEQKKRLAEAKPDSLVIFWLTDTTGIRYDPKNVYIEDTGNDSIQITIKENPKK